MVHIPRSTVKGSSPPLKVVESKRPSVSIDAAAKQARLMLQRKMKRMNLMRR
ncbi:hypothetical protein TanjilG_27456 [Lupinus angustifolius]|uniref:Uncharacterized protein n=1 Tax=Lupinus angustifolius TaxID=3871 RepID=A0A1J7GP23_LUPAN|nr:hypothetical protein TanjilG_27456 [Lupinus angustifolius]